MPRSVAAPQKPVQQKRKADEVEGRQFYYLQFRKLDLLADHCESQCILLNKVGRGGFSTVYNVNVKNLPIDNPPIHDLVVKEMSVDTTCPVAFKSEAESMHRLNGSGITAAFYGAWTSFDGTAFYLLMEKKERDLEKYTERVLEAAQPAITLDWLETFAGRIATSLEVMKARQVWHGDLAPKNIMVEGDGSFVLIDWSPDNEGGKGYIGPIGDFTATYAFSRILLEMICVQQEVDFKALQVSDYRQHDEKEQEWMTALRIKLNADANPDSDRLVALLTQVNELRKPEVVQAELMRRRQARLP